jgi:hypothetical protein
MLAAALGLALAATAAAERAKQPNILFILADVGSFTSHSSRAGQPHPRLVASPHLTQPATWALTSIHQPAAAGKCCRCQDYGWNDIGYHANHTAEGYYNGANPTGAQTTNPAAGMMKTPTLDRLASEGCKLESYYVQPLCSPTRGTIMTGRYPSHTGIGPDVLVENVPYGMPGREKFVAEYLKDAGYKTHAIGKVSQPDWQPALHTY